MESLTWDKPRLLAFQRSQLEQLLRHAKAQVPFYKDRLDVLFRSDGSIDWTRWTDVPILTRADLRDHGKALIAKSLPPGHGETAEFQSSGSTGVPMKVTTTSLSDAVNQALWMRVYALNGIRDIGPEIKFWFSKPGNKPFHERFHIAPDGVIYGNRKLSPREQLSVIAETGARKLSEFTTTMVHLAQENLQRKKPVRLDLVLPYGMGMTTSEHDLIASSFGAKVLSPYSSKEGGLIGFPLLPERSYVVCADALIPEFLPAQDGNGLTRMVITPLFNAAQPLIRYDQGDLVDVSEDTFRGNAFPVIRRIAGRADDYFLLKGMRVPVVGLYEDVLIKHLRARAFQIAQTGDNAVEVRYVASRILPPARKAALTRHLREKLKQTFSVHYAKCKELPASAGGKQKRYKREWPA